MFQNLPANANRTRRALKLAASYAMPIVINSFRNKLVGAVLAGLLVPSIVWAAPSRHPFGNASHPAANSSVHSTPKFKNGLAGARRSPGDPIPAANGNTGINGSGLPDQIVPFQNGNTGINGSGQPRASRRPIGNDIPSNIGTTGDTGSRGPRGRHVPAGGRPLGIAR